MKITLLMVGKTAFSYLEQGISDYSKRITKYCNFSCTHIKEQTAKKHNIAQTKILEGKKILESISPKDYLILLDHKGKSYDSLAFSEHLQSLKETYSTKKIIFLIGGAYGFSDQIYKRANAKISLSKMTFSHQIIRLIFLEQLYRGFTILNNQPYHHE